MAQGDWVSDRTTLLFEGIFPYYLSISNNQLSFTGSSLVPEYEGALVKRAATMSLGGMRVTAQLSGPNNVPAYLIIAAATDWSTYVAVGVRNEAVDIWSGAGFANLTFQKQITPLTIVDGDYVSVDYISGTNTYQVYHHTDPNSPGSPILSWHDQNNIIPHGPATQYAGAMLSLTGWTPCASLKNFAFSDVGGAVVSTTGVRLPYQLPFMLRPQMPLGLLLMTGFAPTAPVGLPLGVMDLSGLIPNYVGMLPLGVTDMTGFAPVITPHIPPTNINVAVSRAATI